VFPDDDLKTGTFHFQLEKFGNQLFVQDLSKSSRLKFQVGPKPYVLDENMVDRCSSGV